jgi:hypothetical protein
MKLQHPIYTRQTCDTDGSFRAFSDFLKLPERPRRLSILLQRYVDEASLKKLEKTPTTSAATIRTWSATNKWISRAIAWDKAQSDLTMQKTLEGSSSVEADEHLKEINEYTRTARQLGRGGANIAIKLKKLVSDAIFREDFPAPRNADEVAILLRAIATTENASMEMWGQAIGVDRLLAQSVEDA